MLCHCRAQVNVVVIFDNNVTILLLCIGDNFEKAHFIPLKVSAMSSKKDCTLKAVILVPLCPISGLCQKKNSEPEIGILRKSHKTNAIKLRESYTRKSIGLALVRVK